jgi:hypothetical protein
MQNLAIVAIDSARLVIGYADSYPETKIYNRFDWSNISLWGRVTRI